MLLETQCDISSPANLPVKKLRLSNFGQSNCSFTPGVPIGNSLSEELTRVKNIDRKKKGRIKNTEKYSKEESEHEKKRKAD